MMQNLVAIISNFGQWYLTLGTLNKAWAIYGFVLLGFVLIGGAWRVMAYLKMNKSMNPTKLAEGLMTAAVIIALLGLIVLSVITLASWIMGEWFYSLSWMKKAWVSYGIAVAILFGLAMWSEIAQIRSNATGSNGWMFFTMLMISFAGLLLMLLISFIHWMFS